LSCSPREDKVIWIQNDGIPDEEADSLYIVVTNLDKIEYEMTAVRMQKYYDTKQTFVDTVFATFYDGIGQIKSTLSCDKAELDDASNTIICRGNVVLESENGIMKAPEAILNRNSEQIFAQKGVTLIRDDNVLYGAQMISDLKLENAEFRQVSAEGKLDAAEIDW
jgi:LPS export ABC transporter protein LptC